MSNRLDYAATPITVAVIFHSGYGHTARQAEAVRRGIERVAGASVLYLTSDEAQSRLDDVGLADAIIFGAPTYMGSASGPFKSFMDFDVKSLRDGRLEGQDRGRLHKLGVTVRGQALNTDAIRDPRGTTWHALGQSRSAARQQQYARLRAGPQSVRLLAGCCGTVEQRSGACICAIRIRSSDRRTPRRTCGKSYAAICAWSCRRTPTCQLNGPKGCKQRKSARRVTQPAAWSAEAF